MRWLGCSVVPWPRQIPDPPFCAGRYKSIDRDLGNGQRNVLQTMLAAREVIPQVSQRRAMLEGSLKQV